jgi:hypothetical protein
MAGVEIPCAHFVEQMGSTAQYANVSIANENNLFHGTHEKELPAALAVMS